jgi:hypothetical protein
MAFLAAALALAAAAEKQNKDSFTPLALDAGFGVMDTAAPSLPAEEIIHRFAAHESEFQQALGRYTWRRAARVQTIDDDSTVDGEYFQVDEVRFDSTGKRAETTVYAPESSLRRIMLSPSDLEEIQNSNSFALTAEEIDQYNVKYVGRQKVDGMNCYVFDASPKVIEKKHRSFSGRIWVDTRGLAIVMTYGRLVPDGTPKKHDDLHPPFMTWRQQVDGQFWFPVYVQGEGTLHFTGGSGFMPQNVHIRETVKYTGYKRFTASPRLDKIEP